MVADVCTVFHCNGLACTVLTVAAGFNLYTLCLPSCSTGFSLRHFEFQLQSNLESPKNSNYPPSHKRVGGGGLLLLSNINSLP